MTDQEFMDKMLAAFPDAEMAVDSDGQIVINTNLMYAFGTTVHDIGNGTAQIVPFEPADEEYWIASISSED